MFETPIYWVTAVQPHRLGLMARPRADEDLREDIESWRAAGVDVVVSLLEAAEVRELGLRKEQAICEAHQIAFRSFPIPDRGTPASARDFKPFANELCESLNAGKSIAIHCRAGIGRTGLVAACLIHRLGVPLSDVFPMLSKSRGLAMPDTTAQMEWVRAYSQRRA